MGKFIDITNQRYGNLKALYPTRKYNRFAWHCLCDCGKECDVESNNLRTGKVQSCGCQKNINIGKKVSKTLIGQKFGNLKVIEKTEQRVCGAVVWKCECECGNICYIPTGNLKTGHTRSCGCLNYTKGKKLNILNQSFGKLKVIEYLGTENSETMWRCECECGNIIKATGWHLTKGLKSSCGCLKSKGELKIKNLLIQNNIHFETQKKFPTCLSPNKIPLRFDFYVNNSYIIEYDGEQHFVSHNTGWSNQQQLEKTQQYDEIKNKWCKENNIPIIRIPYTKYDDLTINDLLLDER